MEAIIYTKDKLYAELYTLISKECDNINLMKGLNEEFSKKGLNIKIPRMILDDAKDIKTLSKMELIAFTEECYKHFPYEDINPKNYFSDSELTNYDTFVNEDFDIINTLVFKNAIQIKDNQWVAYMTLREMYLARKNALIRYNRDAQRKPKTKPIGTKNVHVREAVLNTAAVSDIKQEFKKKNFTPNLITLNILVQDGKTIQYTYEKGTLYITPEYDRDSANTTYVDCIDGYHRYTAACDAYSEELEAGRELEGGLIVSITMMDLSEARNYVHREFKRSTTDKEWLSSIKEDDYSKFADTLVSKINYRDFDLSNKVARDYDTMRFSEDKLTTRVIISDAIKLSKIQVNNISEVTFASKKLAEIISIILITLKSYYDDSFDNMKEHSFLLDCNMFIGYIAIANSIRLNNNNDYDEQAIAAAQKLQELVQQRNNEIRKELSLNNKSYSAIKIYNYFKNILYNEEYAELE